jgi:hypothetical protein
MDTTIYLVGVLAVLATAGLLVFRRSLVVSIGNMFRLTGSNAPSSATVRNTRARRDISANALGGGKASVIDSTAGRDATATSGSAHQDRAPKA